MAIEITQKHREIAARYPYEIRLYGGGDKGTLEFQPRDGTRYVIVFRPVLDEEARPLGHSPGASFVSVMRGANSYQTSAFSDAPMPYYVAEKLPVNDYTARTLARALRFLFNAEDIGPFHEQ